MDPTTEPTTTIERPKEVGAATLLLSASLVIGGIRAVFDLTQKVSGASFFVAVLLLLVFLGVFFFFVNRSGAGRNWARITLLVLLILQLPFALMGSIAEVRANFVHGLVSVVIVILQVLGVGLLFTKNSNLWFRRNR
jgi:hypothetical protein